MTSKHIGIQTCISKKSSCFISHFYFDTGPAISTSQFVNGVVGDSRHEDKDISEEYSDTEEDEVCKCIAVL